MKRGWLAGRPVCADGVVWFEVCVCIEAYVQIQDEWNGWIEHVQGGGAFYISFSA